MIRDAMALAAKGLEVFPCLPRAKRPATANGFKDATTDPDGSGRGGARPDFNVAIATGAVSGVFVVDVDGLDAEAELRQLEAEHGTLPPTVEAITARGRHLYFKMPAAGAQFGGQDRTGIDVRGDGGYVLAPPSCIQAAGVTPGRSTAPARCSGARLAARQDRQRQRQRRCNAAGGMARPGPGCRRRPAQLHRRRLAGYLLRRHIDPLVALELLRPGTRPGASRRSAAEVAGSSTASPAAN